MILAVNAESRGAQLELIGGRIIRYGIVMMLLWIGALKFAAYEAEGVHGLMSHSPLMSWLYAFLTVSQAARLIGIVEIILALMILTRAFAPRVSAIGSLGVIVMSLITLSFVLTTPGVWQDGYGFPFLSANPGGFLAKDILLLGGAVWTAGEALLASRVTRLDPLDSRDTERVPASSGQRVGGSASLR